MAAVRAACTAEQACATDAMDREVARRLAAVPTRLWGCASQPARQARNKALLSAGLDCDADGRG
eukprot:12882308-Prorocentrum_lima.AAC.1